MWLVNNPAFERRPPTIREFLRAPYLDIEAKVRPGLIEALVDIFGDEVFTSRISRYERAMFTGAVGVGKTTFASVVLPYMAAWVLCLKDPQAFFDLLPGSRVAFMQMSTSRNHARDVIFSDVKARINNSRWFRENFPYDDKFTNQLRFPKDVWILPGDSGETTFEGFNILGGILDEGDSHKLTQDRDYASEGYVTIESRIASRFVDNTDPDREGHKGLLICIGQMKSATGFMSRKYKELLKDDHAKVVKMTIWESFGWDKYLNEDGSKRSFYYDIRRKQIVPPEVAGMVSSSNIIEIPRAFMKQFQTHPERALRDLAGIPPQVEDAFISLADRVDECREKWIQRHGDESPVDDMPTRIKFADWFVCNNDPRRRAMHLDYAVSGDGDALGIAMGHIEEIIKIGNEKRPYIVFDFIGRIKARSGSEILLSDVRRMVYELRDDRGFRLKGITIDGYQSTDSLQQFRKARFEADYLSVDKSTLPYEDLREAIYDRRLEFPPYLTYLTPASTERVEIAVQELLGLQFDGRKVDHPANGSKDVSDAMAGVVFKLMGDRNYRKGMTSSRSSASDESGEFNTESFSLPSENQSWEMPHAPAAPAQAGRGSGIVVPRHLRPTRFRG